MDKRLERLVYEHGQEIDKQTGKKRIDVMMEKWESIKKDPTSEDMLDRILSSDHNLDEIMDEIQDLSPRDRVWLWVDLIDIVTPKPPRIIIQDE